MNYPIPKNSQRYWYISENNQDGLNTTNGKNINNFSRTKKSQLMDEFINTINQSKHFLGHIPFVRQIYLCNSITFNALKPDSDIDICIITKPGYLRFARLWTRIFFTIYKVKRNYKKSTKKFCLSFYIDSNNSNIHHLRDQEGDIYLSYRLAHNVLLYNDGTYDDSYIFTSNKELLAYLPNHPGKQSIILDISIQRGSSIFKKIIEFIFSNWLGRQIQYLLYILRGKIINNYKTKKLSSYTRKHIIVSFTILKFYDDKRVLYQQKRKNKNTENRSSNTIKS